MATVDSSSVQAGGDFTAPDEQDPGFFAGQFGDQTGPGWTDKAAAPTGPPGVTIVRPGVNGAPTVVGSPTGAPVQDWGGVSTPQQPASPALSRDAIIAIVNEVLADFHPEVDPQDVADSVALYFQSHPAVTSDYVDQTIAAAVAALALGTAAQANVGAGASQLPTNTLVSSLISAAIAAIPAVTKSTIGLGNVDNTSDAGKPVSTAQGAAIAAAQAAAIAAIPTKFTGTPSAPGSPSAGSSTQWAAGDHTHAPPTPGQIGAATASDLDSRQAVSEKGQPNGYASLGSDGKVLSTQLPAVAVTSTYIVNSQAAMLALLAQEGDVAIRSDLSKSFILKDPGDPTQLANWQEFLTPASPVQSVNGRQGAVTGLLESTNNLNDLGNVATARSNLGLGTAAVTNTGTGATNTILGNDARLTDNRTPLDSSVTDSKISGTLSQTKIQNLTTDLANRVLTSLTIAGIALSGNISAPSLKSALSLTKSDVGLGNVDNTADASKTFAQSQITGLSAALGALQNRLTPTAVKTANYTAAANELVLCDTTSGSFQVTLPSAPASGTMLAVKAVQVTAGNVLTVAAGGTDVFNRSGGSTSFTMTLMAQSVWMMYQSGIWYILADDMPLSQLDLRFQRSGVVTLTDGASIATDCSLGDYFRVTLGGNRTLANPTNPTDGKRYVWELVQDATGSRTITLGSKFTFGTDITSLTLSTGANKVDVLGAIYKLASDKFYVTAVARGF